ncbi:hypothetical protein DVW83_11140 [Enterococcus sp. VV15]|nr:hypothetical protein [Enterococcus sp. VV15]TKN16023.1 hypothetical protein DVW83_11140 [Enterococcus sp. VV15]
MLRSIEEFYGTQHGSATIPSHEKSVYETAQQEFSASKYKENLKTEAAVIFKMTMENLKTQETVYLLEKEAAIGMIALGNQDEQKYNDIIERSNEGILRVQSEITRLEVFQQKDIYEDWNMDKFTESYGRESYAQYKIKLSEARKHRNYQDKERKAEAEFNKIRDNLRKQRKHEVKKVQEGNSLLETLLRDYQSEVQRPTGKRASLIRETAAKIEVVLSEQVESYKRLEAFGQISELKKSEQEKDLSTFEETRSKIKALLAQTKELGFNVEVQPGAMDVPGRKDQAEIVDPKPQTQRSEIKIPIHGKTRSDEEGTRHRSSVHIKLMKAKEAEAKSAQLLVEAKLQRTELKLAVLISSRQMNELQLLEAQGTNREPILRQEAKRLSKEIKELQKEKVDLTHDLDQLKGQKLEFPVEHLSEQEAENELQQADKNTQANTIATKEVSTENDGLFHESQVSQGLAKQAVWVRIGQLTDELTTSAAEFTYDQEMLGAAKIGILAKRAELITQKIRDIEANDTIPPAEKAEIIKVLRELQNENGLEQKAISQENKGKAEWATVIDPREEEPIDVLVEKAKKLADQLDNLKKEHQVVKSEITVHRQEDQDFDRTQGPHFAGTLEFLVQDVQRKERQKEQEKNKIFEHRGVGTDQEGRGKDGRNKGPVPPVPPKPPKEQENKGNDQGQNIGGDQEGRGKDGRNKGPVPPVPPKTTRVEGGTQTDLEETNVKKNKNKRKGQKNRQDQEPDPVKDSRTEGETQTDLEENNKENNQRRNKRPAPPIPPKNKQLEDERPKEKTTKDNGNNPRKGKNRNVGVNTEPAAIARDEENQSNDKKKKRGLGRYFWHKNRNKRASRGIRWLRYLLNLWPIAAWPLCMTWMTVALPFQLIPVVMPAVIATFTAICLSYYLPKIIRFVRKRLLVRRAKKLGLDARSYVKQKEMERNQHNQNKVRKFFRRNWKTIAIILGVTALLGGVGLFLVPAVLGPILTASTISGLMALGGVALTGAAISITVQLFEKFGIVRLEKFFDKKYQQQKTNNREEQQKTNGNISYDHSRHDPNLKKAFAELGNMSINLEKPETVRGKKAKLSEITNKGIDKANTQNIKSLDQQKEHKKKEKAGKENKVVGL